ncbi:MAG: hypothetical protein GY938_23000 [Ketobacter sp.]|nr:hypothetical protein [Ketobacter sp.]
MNDKRLVVNRVIYQMKKRPDDFVFEYCVLTDTKTKYQYWVANGRFNGGIYEPYKMKFGALNSYRFHKAVDQLKNRKHAESFLEELMEKAGK